MEDPAFGNLVLPKLVLQPLVENALYHGIKEKEGQGHIKFLFRNRIQGLSSALRMMALASKLLAIAVKVSSKRGGSWPSKC